MQDTIIQSLRRTARLSQADLAKITGISQATISRVEARPGSASLEDVMKIISALGGDFQQLLSAAGPREDLGTVDVGQPYAQVHQNLSLLEGIIKSDIPEAMLTEIDQLPGLSALRDLVRMLKRKPNVLLSGRSDGGKSRLANALLGEAILPSYYTPATRIPTIVRHFNDRPDWAQGNVLLLSPEFSLDRYDDHQHLNETALCWTSLDALKAAVSHKGRGENPQAHAAIVYVDSPILSAANLFDVPGLQHNEEDSNRAFAALPCVDLLLYLSPVTGFLDAGDISALGTFIKRLSTVRWHDAATPPLTNLAICLTHAAPHVSDEEVEEILDTKSRVLFDHLQDHLNRTPGPAGNPFTYQQLRARFATFWYETPRRCQGLLDLTKASLGTHFPLQGAATADRAILAFKDSADVSIRNSIDRYERLRADIDTARTELKEALLSEGARKASCAAERLKIKENISRYSEETLAKFSDVWETRTPKLAIESFIRANFSDRKNAKEYALSRLLERLNGEVGEFVENKTKDFKSDIDSFLKEYESASLRFPGAGDSKVDIPFDVTAAFLSSLTGAAAAGAMAFWALALGNLAGYAVIAQVVSFLSALGISFSFSSGIAGIVTFVAAIGGPITLAAALAVTGAFAVWALIGEDWQSRLAGRLEKTVREGNLKSDFEEQLKKYWADTSAAFDTAADGLEKSFAAFIDQLKTLCEDKMEGTASIEAILESLKIRRQFFSSLPWTRLVRTDLQ